MERANVSAFSSQDENTNWRGLYLVSAACLLLTATIWFIISRSAGVLYASGYPADPESYLQLVAQHQPLAAATWSLWIVADFLLIAPTVAIYILLRRQHRTLALLGSALAMFFNIYDVCVTELNSLTLVSLAHAYAGAGSDALRAPLVGAATFGYYALPIQTILSFAVGSMGYLLWCIAMWRSLFPKWMAIFGAVASIMGIIGSAAPIAPSFFLAGLFQYLCVPLMALWFIFVGVQLYRHARRINAPAPVQWNAQAGTPA